MKEQIYTVAINDAYDAQEGCPLCFLRAKSETDSLEFFMGPAMMEPDVRMETNKHGFCASHLSKMMGMKNRLSLALILESLYGNIQKKGTEALFDLSEGCSVCLRANGQMAKFRENVVWLWKTEPEFRKKMELRSFCVAHASEQLATADRLLGRKDFAEFAETLKKPLLAQVETIHEDLVSFCRSFDYRVSGIPAPEKVKTAVERAAKLLSSRSE